MKGTVVWITGLPSSGKSRLAGRVSDALRSAAKPCLVLDSDAVRAALEPPPGYDERAREDFYATLANLAGNAKVRKRGVVPVTRSEIQSVWEYSYALKNGHADPARVLR